MKPIFLILKVKIANKHDIDKLESYFLIKPKCNIYTQEDIIKIAKRSKQ